MEVKTFKYFCYPGHNTDIVKWRLGARGGWVEVKEEEEIYKKTIVFVWKNSNFLEKTYLSIDKSGVKDKFFFNHFEVNDCLCMKNLLITSLSDYYKKMKSSTEVKLTVFDVIPLTFVVTSNIFSKEYRNFINVYRDIESGKFPDLLPERHCKNNIWIIKPNNNTDGKGIHLFKNLSDIENFVGTRPNKTQWLIQKYIEYPLTYKDRKVDLRVLTLFTDKNEVYIYKNAFMKTSCYPYNVYEIEGLIGHITSTLVQKMCSEYGKLEEGNTLPIEVLDNILHEYNPKLKIDQHIFPRLIDIIIDVFNSVRNKMNFRHRKNCFELFSFNFVIDCDFRIWLIDVSTTYELPSYCRLLKNNLSKLIDDIFLLTIDKHFSPQSEAFQIGAIDNSFEGIYSEFINKYNKRRAFDKTNFYPVPELIPKNSEGGINPFEMKSDGILDKRYTSLQAVFEEIMYLGKMTSDAFSEITRDCIFVLLNSNKFKPKIVELSCSVLRKISKIENGNYVFIDYNQIGTILNLMMSKTIDINIRQSMCLVFENLLKYSKVKIRLVKLPFFLKTLFSTLFEKENLINDHKALDLNSFVFALIVLYNLIKEERYYLPGETLNNVKLRRSLFKTHMLFLIYEGLSWEEISSKFKEELYLKLRLDEFKLDDFEFQYEFLRKQFPNEVPDSDNEMKSYKERINSINIFVFEKRNRSNVRMIKGNQNLEEKLNINQFYQENYDYIKENCIEKLISFGDYIKNTLVKKYIEILNSKIIQEKHYHDVRLDFIKNRKIIEKLKEEKEKSIKEKKEKAEYMFEKKQEQKDNFLFQLRKSNDDYPPIYRMREVIKKKFCFIPTEKESTFQEVKLLNRFELEELKKKKFSNLRELRSLDRSQENSHRVRDLKKNHSSDINILRSKNYSIDKLERSSVNKNLLSVSKKKMKPKTKSIDESPLFRDNITDSLPPLIIIEKNLFKKVQFLPKIDKK